MPHVRQVCNLGGRGRNSTRGRLVEAAPGLLPAISVGRAVCPYVFSVALSLSSIRWRRLEFGRSQAPTEPHQRCAAYHEVTPQRRDSRRGICRVARATVRGQVQGEARKWGQKDRARVFLTPSRSEQKSLSPLTASCETGVTPRKPTPTQPALCHGSTPTARAPAPR